jgi:hypothetical protein
MKLMKISIKYILPVLFCNLPVLLFSTSGQIKNNRVSLQQAIDSCFLHNPDLKISKLEMEGFAANSTFNSNFYQENYAWNIDKKASQDNESLVQYARASDFVKARRDLKKIEHQLLKAQLSMQMKQYWYTWIYYYNVRKIYRAQAKLMSLCAEVVQENIDSSMLQPVQIARMRAYFEKTLVDVNTAGLNLEDAASDFQQLSGFSLPLIPSDTTMVIATIEKPEKTIASAKLQDAYWLALRYKNETVLDLNYPMVKKAVGVEKANRKLKRDGLNWKLPTERLFDDVPVYQKEKQIMQLDFEKQKAINRLKIADVQNELHQYFTQLNYYRSTGLEYAGMLEQSALHELEKPGPDYKVFLDNIIEAVQLRLDHLSSIYHYNIASTTLEWYLQ